MIPPIRQSAKTTDPPIVPVLLRLAAALFLCLLLAAYAVAWRAPATGTYHDDGIYLVTAKSLAEGHGYRILSLPGEPVQTKYPALFPALLAAVWKLHPDFPANLPFLRLIPMAAAALWLWLSYKLFRELGETAHAAASITALAAASPWIVYFNTALLSESLFAAFMTACLLCVCQLERGSTARWLPWTIGLFAAAAFHTRTAGIALAIAAPLWLWIRGRRRDALTAAASAAVLCLPWMLWCAAHPPPDGVLYAYYTKANYTGWNLLFNFTPAQKLDILLTNLLWSAASPAILAGLPPATIPVLTLALGSVIVWPTLRQRWSVIAIFLAIYSAMVLLWAFPPARFSAPLLPLLYYFAWTAFRHRAVAAVAFTAAAILLVIQIRQTVEYGDAMPTTTQGENWRSVTATNDWLRRNTPANAVLAANLDPLYYLYTGRKAIRGFEADPYTLVYEPGPFPLGQPNAVLGQFHSLPVSHWIVTPCAPFAECRPLTELSKATAATGELEPLETGLPSGVHVYRIRNRTVGSVAKGAPGR